MGRWFQTRRGQAVSIANLGRPASEVTIPILTVLCITAIGWRETWAIVAAILAFIIAPVLWLLLRHERSPQGQVNGRATRGLSRRHWRRRDVARHWLLPALLPLLLTPGFIGTVVFFQQVHIAEVKGWTLVQMAQGYSAFATTTVAAAFAAGWVADRFGAQRLLSIIIVPMAIGIGLVGPAGHIVAWWVALGLIGITQGITSTLWGVLLPVAYGTRHLGSIRSLVSTIMVIATAIGPGVTGLLIDQGIDFPTQSMFMCVWCLVLTFGCVLIDRRLTRELRQD